jgi:hypothetical protein
MLRYLTERLPAMITPRWVDTRIQPIAIRDVLRYLVGAAALPADVSRSFDIGGPDVLTYRQMMHRYAAQAGLARRLIVPVPVLTPTLSSHWVGLVTPVPSSIARPLVDSLRNEVVAKEHDIATHVPDPPDGLVGFDQAVELALQRIRDAEVATRWSSASVPGAPSDPLPTDPDWAGGSLYEDVRRREVHASPAALWKVLEGIGGDHGWYSFPLAWRVRGLADRLVGGVGLRRGRRDAERVYVGETIATRGGCYACAPRCAFRASPGWSSPSSRARATVRRRAPGRAPRRRTSRERSSIPGACWATSTGGQWRPSTASSSAGWPATSPGRPSSSTAASRSPPHRPES